MVVVGLHGLCVLGKINVVHTAKKDIVKYTSPPKADVPFYFCEAVGFRLCRVYKSRLYRSCPVALKLVKECRAVGSFRVACNVSSSKNPFRLQI